MVITEWLLLEQNECTLIWNLADGSATGAVVSYVWCDGAIWMTAQEGCKRVRAIARDPRCAVVVTGKGSTLGQARSLTMLGKSYIRAEADVREQFFPRFAAAVLPNSIAGQQAMTTAMDSEENLVIQFVPDKWIPYDAHDAMSAAEVM